MAARKERKHDVNITSLGIHILYRNSQNSYKKHLDGQNVVNRECNGGVIVQSQQRCSMKKRKPVTCKGCGKKKKKYNREQTHFLVVMALAESMDKADV